MTGARILHFGGYVNMEEHIRSPCPARIYHKPWSNGKRWIWRQQLGNKWSGVAGRLQPLIVHRFQNKPWKFSFNFNWFNIKPNLTHNEDAYLSVVWSRGSRCYLKANPSPQWPHCNPFISKFKPNCDLIVNLSWRKMSSSFSSISSLLSTNYWRNKFSTNSKFKYSPQAW